MSASLDALLLEESKLTRPLEHAQAACRRCAGDERREDRAHRSTWVLDGAIRNTVPIIYILCDFEELPVSVYLCGVGMCRRWPSMPDGYLLKLTQECFAAADLRELVSLTAVDEPSDATAMQVAMKMLQEWRLMKWGLDLNANGVAPSTCDLLRQAATSYQHPHAEKRRQGAQLARLAHGQAGVC